MLVAGSGYCAADWREIEAQRRLEADRTRHAREAMLQSQGVRKAAMVTHTPMEWKAIWQKQQEARTALSDTRMAMQQSAESEAKAIAVSLAEMARKENVKQARMRFIMFWVAGLVGFSAFIVLIVSLWHRPRIRIVALAR